MYEAEQAKMKEEITDLNNDIDDIVDVTKSNMD